MRTAILIVAAALGLAGTAATPAAAQTYDPDYPVCLKRFGEITSIHCRYSSIDQCQVSASGIGATCLENPYFVGDRRRERGARRY